MTEAASGKRAPKNRAHYPAIPYIAPIANSSSDNNHYDLLVSEVERLCAIELEGLRSYFDTHLPNRSKPLEALCHILQQLPKHVSSSCQNSVIFMPEGSSARLADSNDEVNQVEALRKIVADMEGRLAQLASEESIAIHLDLSADIHTAHRICADELASLDDGLSAVLDGLGDINVLMEAAENKQGTLYDVRTLATTSAARTGSTSAATPKKILRSMQRL